jgi:YD repeat-containing protein
LRAQEATNFDDQGRAYQNVVYDVSPTTGAVSTSLVSNTYRNHRGEVIATSGPGGLWNKSSFDGAGREIFIYATDGAGGTTWAAAGSVASDNVLEQRQEVYDSDGNAIEAITSQRFHDETATGALGNPTTTPRARVSYTARYFDLADRRTADVDVGTNGGTVWVRPSSVPTGSSTVLVTSYAYNAAGWVQDTTDPRGLDERTYYDALARATKEVKDYTGGTPGPENDVAVEYTRPFTVTRFDHKIASDNDLATTKRGGGHDPGPRVRAVHQRESAQCNVASHD